MKKITNETLMKWDACSEGVIRFNELFPNGETLEKAAYALKDDGHIDWGVWLYNKARKDNDFKEQAEKGFCNTGNYNTGHWNTGHYNTGDRNTGYWNTGHWNTGYRNTGHWNTGDRNTGDYNTGDRNTGYFNTITPSKILVFNKEIEREHWDKAIKPDFIFKLELTYWVSEEQMTDEDKKVDPNFYARGGQLRSRSYKEAWKIAYDKASKTDIKLLKALPCFDSDVFEAISGIRVD